MILPIATIQTGTITTSRMRSTRTSGERRLLSLAFGEVFVCSCSSVIMDPLAVSEQGESKFFVTTFFTLDKLFYVRRGNRTCPRNPEDVDLPASAQKLGKFSGSCLYTLEEQYFPISPENTILVSRMPCLARWLLP